MRRKANAEKSIQLIITKSVNLFQDESLCYMQLMKDNGHKVKIELNDYNINSKIYSNIRWITGLFGC